MFLRASAVCLTPTLSLWPRFAADMFSQCSGVSFRPFCHADIFARVSGDSLRPFCHEDAADDMRARVSSLRFCPVIFAIAFGECGPRFLPIFAADIFARVSAVRLTPRLDPAIGEIL